MNKHKNTKLNNIFDGIEILCTNMCKNMSETEYPAVFFKKI